MCGLRVQLLGIILSIALCLAVREQRQQLQKDEEVVDDVDGALLEKNDQKPLDEEEPAEWTSSYTNDVHNDDNDDDDDADIYMVGQKRGHSAFSRISRKL